MMIGTNRTRRGFLSALVFLLLLPGLDAGEPESAMGTARKLIDAFNRHDAKAMASLVSDDFQLFYIDDKGSAGLALEGPRQLIAEMTGYFSHVPSVRSEVVGVVDGPVFVSFREQIVGGQSSLAVYEVRDGLIRRVWYYPAE